MRIITGRSKRHWRKFHALPKRIYSNDPLYIPLVRQEVEGLFNNSNDDRWTIVLVEKSDTIVARAIAFIQKGLSETGGIGFLDFADDDLVSSMLLQACSDFIESHGCNQIQTPVNFGERDRYWGLRISGDGLPSYQENYNPNYYEEHLLAFGFTRIFEQSTLELRIDELDDERLKKINLKLASRGIQVRQFSNRKREKFASDFVEIYNQAWWEHEHFQPMTEERVLQLLVEMKPIIREPYLLFAYDGDKPIGFFLAVIELNQIMQHLNGNMNWWGKIQFLFWKRLIRITRLKGIIFGVIPEYQSKGVGASMVLKMHENMKKDANLEAAELAWIGDFNDRMNRFIKALGAREIKRHATYSKNL